MSRVRKLLIVGLVLTIGMGLAWPFRKTGPSTNPGEPRGAAFDSLATAPSLPEQEPTQIAAQRHTAAKMASTGGPTQDSSFDLSNHPALANQPISQSSDFLVLGPVTPSDRPQASVKRQQPSSRPAYATDVLVGEGEAEQRQEILHIVRNTDTLEKLAKRYLGDAGRALEIFDLNRDQLSNPHLLPIGAKLKIPVAPERELD